MSDSSSNSSSSSDSEDSPKNSTLAQSSDANPRPKDSPTKSSPAQSSKAGPSWKDDDKSSSSGSSSNSESPGPTKNVESKVEAAERDNSEAPSPTKNAERKIEPKVGDASNLLDSEISGTEQEKKQENKALVAAADMAPEGSSSSLKKTPSEDSAGSVKKKQVRTADMTSEDSAGSVKKKQVRTADTSSEDSAEDSASSLKKQQGRKARTADMTSEVSVSSVKKQQVRKVRTANMCPDDSTDSAKKQQVRNDSEALVDTDAHDQEKQQATTRAKVDRDATESSQSSESEPPVPRKNAKGKSKSLGMGRALTKGSTMSKSLTNNTRMSVRNSNTSKVSKDSKFSNRRTLPNKAGQALFQSPLTPKAKTSPNKKFSAASKAILPAQTKAKRDTVKVEDAAPRVKKHDTIAPIVARAGRKIPPKSSKSPKGLRDDRKMRLMKQIARKDPPLPDVAPIKNVDSVILPMVTLLTVTPMSKHNINRLDVDIPFIAKCPAGHPGGKESQTTDMRMFEAAFDICRTPAATTLDREQARNWLRCVGWCLDDYGLDTILDFNLGGPRPALAVDEQEKKQKTGWNLSALIILASEVLNNNSGIENATTEALNQGIDSLVCGKQHVTLRRVRELLDRELRFDPDLPVNDIERVLENCGLVEGKALENVEFARSLFNEIVTAGHAHFKKTQSLPFCCD